MTIEEFKKLKISAMKERKTNVVNAYNAIISKLMLQSIECKANGKEITEAETVACIKKVEKEMIEERDSYAKGGREDVVNDLNEQLQIIKSYIPQMMDATQIKQEILKLDDKSVPTVMKHFKTNFAGKVDMKLVGEVLKTL